MDPELTESKKVQRLSSGKWFDRLLLLLIFIFQIYLFVQYREISKQCQGLDDSGNTLEERLLGGSEKSETAGVWKAHEDTRDVMIKDMNQAMEDAHRSFETVESMIGFDVGWDVLAVQPAMDIREGDDAFTVVVSLPNVSDKVAVRLDGSLLTITSSNNANGHMEQYEQKVMLPAHVAPTNDLVATVTNNAIRIVIPKM